MAPFDVIVVGAGPAGAVAATVLARAGVRVVLLDRDVFPRRKLCGDTLNPGALGLLRELRLATVADTRGVRIDGMVVSGEGGVTIEGRYPAGLFGRAIGRSELDAALVREAVAAGVELRERTVVRDALVEASAGMLEVVGVRASANGATEDLRAPVTIAADGRRSTVAFGLGLVRHARRPRRWAVGAYAEHVYGVSSLGEMHVRRGHYLGVAPLPGGLANVCLVVPAHAADRSLGNPLSALTAAVARDESLRERFAAARFHEPIVLGPLAVDVVPGATPPSGLLLAGDAAGFVDPMTGDGLRFAIRGGTLAAGAALEALANGWLGVHDRWLAARHREFHSKIRFNRSLRALVSSPVAVCAATVGARLAPAMLRALIVRASDCDVAAHVGAMRPPGTHEYTKLPAAEVENS